MVTLGAHNQAISEDTQQDIRSTNFEVKEDYDQTNIRNDLALILIEGINQNDAIK